MSNHLDKDLLLVGVGTMAQAYAAVLSAQERRFTVVGRSEANAKRFREQTGIEAISGGVERICRSERAQNYSSAIVAVGVEALSSVTTEVLQGDIRRVLVEKPAGLCREEIEGLQKRAEAKRAEVYVAYNRRFYASTQALKHYAQEDGGVSSFFFEFTEWSDRIQDLKKAPGIKENWLLANSSHVIDLAFHLGGAPEEICALSARPLAWHPKGAFVGAGRSITQALFAYHANWDAPGRWGVEVLTPQRRFILRPLEELRVQVRNSTRVEQVPIEDELDRRFKPGLFAQVNGFLKGPGHESRLCTLEQQLANSKVYERILQGANLHPTAH